MNVVNGLSDASSWIWPLVADHLWQATVFSALALGAAALLERGPARARQCVWLLASLKVALPSFVLVSLAGIAGLEPPMSAGSAEPANGLAAIPKAIDRVAAPFSRPLGPASDEVPSRDLRGPACTVLTLAWATGLVATSASWWRRRRRLSRALAPGRALTAGREMSILARAARRTGTTVPISLVVSEAIEQPGVHGVMRPVVVLPEGVAARLTDAELEAVFVHELVHVRRRDNLIGNLHMALCCLFWFYPIVWLLDRKLLVERERVCDDEVLDLSETPGVYASSLLKVCRFCLGPRVAGVSAAAGTGMRDRVARIVAYRCHRGLTSAQRALVGACGVAFAMFVGAGLLDTNRAAAVASMTPPPPGSLTGTPPAGATPARVDAARSVAISFENPAGAPVVIRAASVRIVPLDSGELLVTPPRLNLHNASGRRVESVRVGLESTSRWNDVVRVPVAIEPAGDSVLEPDWRSWSNTVRADETGRLVARVMDVRFEGDDGREAPDLDDPAPGAPPNKTVSPPVAVSPPVTVPVPVTVPARFENPAGAPVIMVDARTDTTPSGRGGGSRLPVVTLANTTEKRVTHLKLRFKANSPAHAVSAFAADIAPGGTYVFRSDGLVNGDPERMHVQLLGVRFEDGMIWGAFDTTIDTRDPTVSVPQYIHQPDP